MALLNLPRVSRATTSSGKEFRVDATFRTNYLRLQAIAQNSWTILKRWPRVVPLQAKIKISSGHIPHLLWNIYQHLMTSVLSIIPSTENKSTSFSLWEYVRFSKPWIIFVRRLCTFFSNFMSDIYSKFQTHESIFINLYVANIQT